MLQQCCTTFVQEIFKICSFFSAQLTKSIQMVSPMHLWWFCSLANDSVENLTKSVATMLHNIWARIFQDLKFFQCSAHKINSNDKCNVFVMILSISEWFCKKSHEKCCNNVARHLCKNFSRSEVFSELSSENQFKW